MIMKKLLISYAMALVAASVLTLKTEMEALHQIFGVNFIYDSSLVLDVPYKGKPMSRSLARPYVETRPRLKSVSRLCLPAPASIMRS